MPEFLDKLNSPDNSSDDVSLLDLHKPHDINIDSVEIPQQKPINSPTQTPLNEKTLPTPEVNNTNLKIDHQTNIPINKSVPSGAQNIPLTNLAETIAPEEKEVSPISEIKLPETKPTNRLLLFAKIILALVGVFIFIYAFLNFPAIAKRLGYSYKESTGLKPQVQTIIPQTVNRSLLFLDTVTHYAPAGKTVEIVKLPSKESLGVSGLENDQLWIPKIDVKAPIVWDSPVDEATAINNLKYGVVHYKGTTKPGETAEDGQGNVFISGHSSYYWWDDGKYKTIFANLDKLNVGDEIAVGYKDTAYIYKVTEKKEVNPDDISVLAQNTDKPTISLMTCVPVGTNLRRLIVKAELVGRASD